MCGIVGIVHLDGAPSNEATDGAFLREAARRIAHRGPDDEQFFYWGPVGIGFRRLAIVDLDTGRQPLANGDGTIVQVTNGEIYNHEDLRRSFLDGRDLGSRSDCAVIPYLYEKMGLRFLAELNGMFATAVVDQKQRKLVLARDRLGIKPLYYYADSKLLVFGSEIKAVLACPAVPRSFDWRSALTYTREEFYPRPGRALVSFFDKIEHLPGGTALEVDLATGTLRRHHYWDIDLEPDAVPRSAEDYVEDYRYLLEDSVRLRLMADVEYGLFLSGGIDSVAIARLASTHGGSFHTFSVLGQSTLTNGDSESAHRAARACGIENHQVHFDWRELDATASDWKRILWETETFEAGAEQYYKYLLHGFARRLRPGLKVMLLGQGSDEFNGGYSKRWAEQWSRPEEGQWEHFEEAWRSAELASLRRSSGLATSYDGLRTVEASFGVDRPPHESVVAREFLAEPGGWGPYRHPWHAYRDAYRYNLQMFNLWHEDRTAAAHSTENRVPFLDHRLVELTLRVPPNLYRELFWDKAILRRAMAHDLPEAFCLREKGPFFVGEDERYTRRLMYRLLRSEDDRLIHEGIAGSRRSGGILDETYLWRLVEDQPNDPEYRGVDSILQLVNMGLLQTMASEPPALERRPVAPAEIKIDDWESFREGLGVAFVERQESLTLASVPRFAEGVLLTRCEGGDPSWIDEGGYYIIVNNELRFLIEPSEGDWIDFLRQVDGKNSVESILTDGGLARERVWKHLEEAVELGVLEI